MIDSFAGGDSWRRCDVTLRRRGLSSSVSASPLGAQVRVAVGLHLVVTLSDLVDRVGGHSGCSLHAGQAVTRLAAGVFRANVFSLPSGGETESHDQPTGYFLYIFVKLDTDTFRQTQLLKYADITHYKRIKHKRI